MLVHRGEVLLEEFFCGIGDQPVPLGAGDDVPESRINAIREGRRAITCRPICAFLRGFLV